MENKSEDKEYMKKLMAEAEDLEIVGIVQPKEGANASARSRESAIRNTDRYVADLRRKVKLSKHSLEILPSMSLPMNLLALRTVK